MEKKFNAVVNQVGKKLTFKIYTPELIQCYIFQEEIPELSLPPCYEGINHEA